MYISFESLNEFHDMAKALGYVRRSEMKRLVADAKAAFIAANTGAGCADVLHGEAAHGHVSIQETGDSPDTVIAELRTVAPYTVEEKALLAAVVAKRQRKRRTKAEIEAEKGAQVSAPVEALPSDPPREAPRANPLDNLKSETSVIPDSVQVHAEIAAMAALYDGSTPDAKLAHLDEGRDFIAKHGFLAYNETLALAGVPANIATHTPEQASLHRAAMAWKVGQVTKGIQL